MQNAVFVVLQGSLHPNSSPSKWNRRWTINSEYIFLYSNFDIFSHLRVNHCSQEGGSFVCLYGENKVCSSLPVEGISDADYEQHIYKHHVFAKNKYRRHKRQTSTISTLSDVSGDQDKWNVYSASQNLAAVLNNPHKIKQVNRLWNVIVASVIYYLLVFFSVERLLHEDMGWRICGNFSHSRSIFLTNYLEAAFWTILEEAY